MNASVSVVAPVYNNSSSIEELVRRVLAVFDDVGLDGEFVLVDDGSADESWALINYRPKPECDVGLLPEELK